MYSDPSYSSEMHRQGTLLTTNVCNPAFGGIETRHREMKQFQQFVLDTYDELRNMESKQLMAKSSLGVFGGICAV